MVDIDKNVLEVIKFKMQHEIIADRQKKTDEEYLELKRRIDNINKHHYNKKRRTTKEPQLQF